MKDIYIISLHLQQGGVQLMVTQMADAFVRMGYNVHILCTYHLGAPAYPLNDQVVVHYLTDYRPNRDEFKEALKHLKPFRILAEGIKSLKILRAKKKVLIDAFQEIEDGIIISTRNEDSVLLSRYGRKNTVKIAQIHHEIIHGDKYTHDIENNYNNIDYLAVLTKETKDIIDRLWADKNQKTECVVLENFIKPIQIDQTDIREKVILSVGRLHPDKGYDRLLHIFSSIHTKYPEWKLKIIGAGTLKEELVQLSEDLGIRSFVEFTGFMNNTAARLDMRKAAIFTMTSSKEGFGIVLVEAMEAGLPVITFNGSSGPRSIVTHGENGFLVEKGNETEFISYIEKLVEDKVLREKMSDAARRRAEDFYMDRIISKWIEIFNKK